MTDTLTAPAAEAMPAPVAVKGGVAPYIMLADAAAAAEFYKRALGAEEPGGRHAAENGAVLHLHLYINGGSVMLMDPMPEYGHPLVPPGAISLHLQVDDADAWFARAVEAGCTVVMPVDLQFWGDRYGAVKDPFGVDWSFGSTPR
jgi:uncharacterized glyoxalase superfamily protein PhnB